ncbi:hypothetical protein ABZZ80_42790 [Streptomyces sp. NPDC006356]
MDPLVLAAGSAVVTAMVTDGWQQARDAVVAWWRTRHADEAESVRADLESLRLRALAIRDGRNVGDVSDGEDWPEQAALVAGWAARFQRLLDEDPDTAAALRELTELTLPPEVAPAPDDQGPVVMKADARDHARVFMAGHDQHITGS